MACAPSGLDSACFGMSRDPLLLSGPPLSPCTWTCFARMAWAFLSQQEPHHTLHFNLFPSHQRGQHVGDGLSIKEPVPRFPALEFLP